MLYPKSVNITCLAANCIIPDPDLDKDLTEHHTCGSQIP